MNIEKFVENFSKEHGKDNINITGKEYLESILNILIDICESELKELKKARSHLN